MNTNKNTQLENQFITRYVKAEESFQNSINQANTLIGIPDESKVTSVSALLRALTYEMDITFKVRKGSEKGELGLPIPDLISEESVISQNRISKVKSRLASSFENKQELDQIFLNKARDLESQFPGYKLEDYIRAVKSLYIFNDLNRVEEDNRLIKTLLNGFNVNDQIKFLLFVCPPVDYTYLRSNTPEDYVRTSISISLIKDQLPRISELIQSLNIVGVKSGIDIFIGDDDDEKYISVTEKYQKKFYSLNFYETQHRRNEFLLNLRCFLKTNNINNINISNLSSLDYKPDYSSLNEFSEHDFEEEISRMRELWGLNNYYEGLPIPSNEELRRIVEAKFATYAAQGKLAKKLEKNSILIQTERPPKLRTKMLNTSLIEDEQIPAIYLFNK